jgi:hypothetical protein
LENKTVNAANNPGLANKLAQEALKDTNPEPQPVVIKSPSDVTVDLPGGYITPDGEVYRTAELRELTGKDEEVIIKSTNFAKSLSTMVSRGTVKIGNLDATEDVLDRILMADRDALLVGIYRATFGDTMEVNANCSTCSEAKTVEINLVEDIKTKFLEDPIEDRRFTIQGRKSEYSVILPENKIQKELISNSNINISELDTLLLEYCVVAIDGRATLGRSQIQSIGLADRKTILKAIIEKSPGPKFDEVKVTCPDCGGEVVVPISVGSLFRL